LTGPVNDVRLVSDMLVDQFRFSTEDIVVLSEERGSADLRPLKQNIVRELEELAEQASTDDQVVIYFSGHGTQQPDDDADSKEDLEPDGMDEVFCPADVLVSTFGDSTSIPNGLSDDELRKYTGDIRASGASIRLVVDACHSGTAVRGNRVYRQLRPEQMLPAESIAAARRRAARTRSVSSETSGMDGAEGGGLIAFYAAQPHEPTFETEMPFGDEDAVSAGSFTYTLVSVLAASNSNMTYSELAQRIHDQYVLMGLVSPTPLIEGIDRDREVLGEHQWPDRSHLSISVTEDGSPKIDAG